MPIAGDRARLKNQGAGLDLDHDDDGRRDCDGGCRVEQDAEWAVVGIGVDRMHVGYLYDGEQRQQDKTHYGDDRQSTWLCAAFSAKMCLNCCQTTTSTSRIHKIRCEGAGRGYARRLNLDLLEWQT